MKVIIGMLQIPYILAAIYDRQIACYDCTILTMLNQTKFQLYQVRINNN